MATDTRACGGAPEPGTDSADVSRRYAIVIGETRIRTICGDAAVTTFRRWSRSPDVAMRGDLRTGFCWEWPDPTHARISIVPEPDRDSAGHASSPAVPAQRRASGWSRVVAL